jgi:hypothetical protein
MELPVDTLTTRAPKVRSGTAAATRRTRDSHRHPALAAFLKGLGFATPQAIDAAIDMAFCDVDATALSPAARFDHLRRRVVDWFAHVLDRSDANDEAILSAGRVAFLLTGAARRWPEHFLAEEGLPEGMIAALRAVAPRPVPAATPRRMADQALDPMTAGDALRGLLAIALPLPSGRILARQGNRRPA